MCFCILGGVSSEEIPGVITCSKGRLRIALSDIAKFPYTRVMPICISTSNALKNACFPQPGQEYVAMFCLLIGEKWYLSIAVFLLL